MQSKTTHLLHAELTECILGCCFEVMNELGIGFLEKVYQRALIVAMSQIGLQVHAEKRFELFFRGHRVGVYIADLIVNQKVVVELKCCEHIHNEHQAQLINYLKVSNMPIGLLVNFGRRKIEYRRLCYSTDLVPSEKGFLTQ